MRPAARFAMRATAVAVCVALSGVPNAGAMTWKTWRDPATGREMYSQSTGPGTAGSGRPLFVVIESTGFVDELHKKTKIQVALRKAQGGLPMTLAPTSVGVWRDPSSGRWKYFLAACARGAKLAIPKSGFVDQLESRLRVLGAPYRALAKRNSTAYGRAAEVADASGKWPCSLSDALRAVDKKATAPNAAGNPAAATEQADRAAAAAQELAFWTAVARKNAAGRMAMYAEMALGAVMLMLLIAIARMLLLRRKDRRGRDESNLEVPPDPSARDTREG